MGGLTAPAVPCPTATALVPKEESEAQWAEYWRLSDKFYGREDKVWSDSTKKPTLLPRKLSLEDSNQLYEEFVLTPFQFVGKLRLPS